MHNYSLKNVKNAAIYFKFKAISVLLTSHQQNILIKEYVASRLNLSVGVIKYIADWLKLSAGGMMFVAGRLNIQQVG